ncbi:VIT domain-containing protein [Thermodesulfobacteriota bacterium]
MGHSRVFLATSVILLGLMVFWPAQAGPSGIPGQGTLTIIEPDGKTGTGCPLEHTSVKGEVAGFVARVSVTQVFHNPRKDKIEAVYTFPLPNDAAVDDMLMRVGDRVVRGEIKRREEARQVYERARNRGQVASLLDQDRPNIFTQSVANIMPGEKVEITIKYVQILPYDDGSFKFVFPMVVGPRFIPGKPTGKSGTGREPDTTQVPDASRITPPVTPEGVRAGHDVDLTLSIDAGVPILGIDSKLHEVDVKRNGKTKAVVSLKDKKEIPNRDFVLKYEVAGDKVKSGLLSHKEGKNGYVAVIMIPPKRVKPAQIAPKEMIFVIDCSGSQTGKPLQKAKETMKYVIENMNPDDTFNIIDFNVGARALFSEPKKNTPEYREKAQEYLNSLRARGGTWMGPAIETVCKTPAPENRLRIVTFMTDGYVGNDFQIISLVKKLRGKSRWFPFGTGNSVNRFLLDNMARVGGGEVEYILLNSPGEAVAKKFFKRIATPVLTDISLSVKGIKFEQIYPKEVSDLWDRKPLVFKARYAEPGKGTITIKGHRGVQKYEQTLNADLPKEEKENASLGSLWARAKVDDLMDKDWMGAQRGTPDKKIKEEIIKVALAHRIMTQYTSFVAVEETVVTVKGKPTKVTVPVEMPDGVSREGALGEAMKRPRAGEPRRKRVVPHYQGGVKWAGTPQEQQRPKFGSGKPVRGVHPKANYPRVPQGAAPVGTARPAEEEFSNDTIGTPPPQAQAPPPMPRKTATGRKGGWEFPMKGEYDGAPPPVGTRPKPSAGRPVDKVAAGGNAPPADRDQESIKEAMVLYRLSQELRDLLKRKGKIKDYSKGKVVVKDGKVMVKVWLTKTSDEILKKLKEAGLEISFKATTGKMVLGIVPVEKLKALSKINAIRLIEPFSAG